MTVHEPIPVTTRKDWTSDQEVRWCPGCGDYSILTAVQLLMPDLGVRRENTVFVSGHRLRRPVPVLHEHLRDALDPRPGTGHRHRPGHGPPRPRRVGGGRRRRRAVDRRQPPDPRPAPQRQPHDPDVQQPDLRADQGPVLAHQRGRQGHQVHAVRLARPPVQPAVGGPRRRGQLRGPHPRHGPRPHDRDVPAGPRPPGRGVRRDLPELQRLQRRRLRGHHGQAGPRRHADPARPRRADPLRCRRRSKGVVLDAQHGARIVDVADVGEDALLVHDEARADPGVAFMLSRLARGPSRAHADRRVPGRRAARVRRPRSTASSPPPAPTRAPATSPPSSAAAPPGTSPRSRTGTHNPQPRNDAAAGRVAQPLRSGDDKPSATWACWFPFRGTQAPRLVRPGWYGEATWACWFPGRGTEAPRLVRPGWYGEATWACWFPFRGTQAPRLVWPGFTQGRPWNPAVASLRSGSLQPRLRKTRPVLGLGAKNVVFGGMRSPPWAVSSIWRDGGGPQEDAGLGRPRFDRGSHVVDAVLEGELVLREGGEGDVEAARVEVADAAPSASGRGRSRTSRSGSTSVRQPASTMAAVIGATPPAAGRPARTSGARAATRSAPSGRPVSRRWMACTVSSSSTSSTT